MRYVSTRGRAKARAFDEILLSGMAEDGGLYVPETLPRLAADWVYSLRRCSYPALATRVLRMFAAGALPDGLIADAAQAAYTGFRHPALAPLKQMDRDRWLLELFHGPTFAFKDYALQLLGALSARVVAQRGRRLTVVCATSGDTGAAAAAAFAGLPGIRVVVLHPEGRVSPVQRRQMTTLAAGNLTNLAVQGTFDDCQAIVKALFADEGLCAEVGLAAVNSINWARIASQVTYYAWASLRLGSSAQPVDFTVPTGNFGNVYAGRVARALGFPVGRLLQSSNENDVLPRFFESGVMEGREVVPTLSPSMDIQVSSNFERFLYELKNHDGAAVAASQDRLKREGRYRVTPEELARARALFAAVRCGTEDALEEIRQTYRETGEVLCPHTATAVHVARRESREEAPMVAIATAHPAKFPEAIRAAIDIDPPLPATLGELLSLPEHFQVVPNEVAAVRAVLLENP